MPADRVRHALKVSGNNGDMAMEWLFSNMDTPIPAATETKTSDINKVAYDNKKALYRLESFINHQVRAIMIIMIIMISISVVVTICLYVCLNSTLFTHTHFTLTFSLSFISVIRVHLLWLATMSHTPSTTNPSPTPSHSLHLSVLVVNQV